MAKSKGDGEEERQRLADRVLGWAEDAIYWGIAVVLLLGSVAILVAQFAKLLHLRDTPTSSLAIEILDGLLLIFIFVELLYAVRVSLRSHEIVVELFLIVGILAAIKEIVVLSVESAKEVGNGAEFTDRIVEIAVLGVLVLLLGLTSFLLRLKEREPDEGDSGKPPPERRVD